MEDNSLPKALPEEFFALAAGRVEEDANLAERFKLVLRGFEEFALREWLREYRYSFEDALQDFKACVTCSGKCRSTLYVPGGTPMYFALDYWGIKNSGANRPVFKAFLCPGPVERKKRIEKLLLYRGMV